MPLGLLRLVSAGRGGSAKEERGRSVACKSADPDRNSQRPTNPGPVSADCGQSTAAADSQGIPAELNPSSSAAAAALLHFSMRLFFLPLCFWSVAILLLLLGRRNEARTAGTRVRTASRATDKLAQSKSLTFAPACSSCFLPHPHAPLEVTGTAAWNNIAHRGRPALVGYGAAPTHIQPADTPPHKQAWIACIVQKTSSMYGIARLLGPPFLLAGRTCAPGPSLDALISALGMRRRGRSIFSRTVHGASSNKDKAVEGQEE
ncbi:hypothetical protein CDD83_8628 [Cordyceps sp. RAO-2017]|nr:hypothetical protein CDD83_8628 [Cordyceps sp. RAO-2017]